MEVLARCRVLCLIHKWTGFARSRPTLTSGFALPYSYPFSFFAFVPYLVLIVPLSSWWMIGLQYFLLFFLHHCSHPHALFILLSFHSFHISRTGSLWAPLHDAQGARSPRRIRWSLLLAPTTLSITRFITSHNSLIFIFTPTFSPTPIQLES